MPLLKILEVIMTEYTLLINNIRRSEAAYKIYCKCSNYHQALHIFHANKKVYDELSNLLEVSSITKELSSEIFNYLFHLEDWFLQFSLLEKEVVDIEGKFSFSPLKSAISYPSDFLEMLSK